MTDLVRVESANKIITIINLLKKNMAVFVIYFTRYLKIFVISYPNFMLSSISNIITQSLKIISPLFKFLDKKNHKKKVKIL